MIKKSDLAAVLSNIKDQASSAAGTGLESIRSWYEAQPESARKAIIHGLIGAGTGAALAGGSAAMRKRDPDESFGGAVLSPALMGALLGGTAGAGLSLGKGLITGAIKVPGTPPPQPKPVLTKLTDPVVRGAVSNAGILGGLAAALRSDKGPRSVISQLIDAPKGGRAHVWSGIPTTSRLGLLKIPAYMFAGNVIQRAVKGDY